ncbi:MAG TPA: 3-oxoacyl-ACP reductase family protein [Caldilineaceae bacterium]|nr:3-oxoacyl-ACP reductase family protein [Caldilineaceae bacterium]
MRQPANATQGKFTDRVVLVTGGSRGIGRAVVLAFAAQSAQVAFCYHSNHTAAGALCQEAAASGWTVHAYQADVADPAQAEGFVAQAVARFGRVDVMVNNAGRFVRTPVAEMNPDEWEQVIRSNLYSVFYCCRAVLPHMARQGSGSIINLASIAGKRGSAYHAHYAAAKGGVLAFTRSLAREVIGQGIRVNAVCPGRVATELLLAEAGPDEEARWRADTPIGRLGTPEEVAAAVLFLAGDDAAYIVGETLDVDGGLLMD